VGCSVLEMSHNNPFRYPPIAPPGISHDLSLMEIPDTIDTINPIYLNKSNFDSGFSDLESLLSQSTKVFHRQWSKSQTGTGGGVEQVSSGNTEVHVHQHGGTSTGGGAGRVTSGSEAPEQDLKLKLLERLNSVLEVFWECKQSPEGRRVVRECARNIALSAPEDFSQVFVETYHGAKGKGEERG